MGKKIVIPGADFSQNGIRTSNVVEVVFKEDGTSPYTFYFLPTAATYVEATATNPSVPNDAVTKVLSVDGQEPINSDYAGFLFGAVDGGDFSTIILDSLSVNNEKVADYRMGFEHLKLNHLDLRRVNFGENANISRLLCNSSVQDLKMPNIYATSIRKAFYNFNSVIYGTHVDFSFIKKVSSDLTNAFQFLKTQTANFNGIDVSEATLFSGAFASCTMAEINLADWHVDSCEWTKEMFKLCSKLTTIHLDNWNSTFSNSARYTDMFTSTPALTTVYVTNCSSTVKTWLIARLNECTAGGSSNWVESTVDGKAALVKGS